MAMLGPILMLALAGGAPVAALGQDLRPIAACAGPSGFSAPGCDPAAAAVAIDLDGMPLVRRLHEAGVESFAVLWSLRRLAAGIEVRTTGGDCTAQAEALHEADAVWSGFVRRPDGLSGPAAESFDLADGFAKAAFDWLSEEAC